MTDPIADFLTRIRNAYSAGKKVVEIPSSNMKVAITKILCEKSYILSYKVVEGTPYNTIKIALKYHPETKAAAIKSIVRVSTPVCGNTPMWPTCPASSMAWVSLCCPLPRALSPTRKPKSSTLAVRLFAMFTNRTQHYVKNR